MSVCYLRMNGEGDVRLIYVVISVIVVHVVLTCVILSFSLYYY
jgi:hypothetical protein